MPRANRLEFYRKPEPVGWRWRWHLLAPNGRIIGASSEAFTSPGMARKNAVLNYYDGLRSGRIVCTHYGDEPGVKRWVKRIAADEGKWGDA